MRILLTGNKGFIGGHLQPKLEKLGHKVIGMDIKNSRGEDIRSELCVKAVFKKSEPDVIIHLAALAGVRKSLEEPKEYFETNITGTYYLLREAEKYNIKNFLLASSSSVYGDNKSPLKENMDCNYQLSPYALSKKTGELICRMFENVPTMIFRPFTVYGENGRKEMVIRKLITAGQEGLVFEKYGEGKSSRGYTHIDDLTDGIIALLRYRPIDNFMIFNLGGNEQITLNELIEIVKDEFPKLKVKEIPRNPADTKHSLADMSRVKSLVDFTPKKKFKEEIKRLCKNGKNL